ncbi:DMT family transporter [Brevifollis gellanilyticus]|nr:DMT family transporter [Brevifollis gellanilyticus]
MNSPHQSRWMAAIPWLFVLLWSSGFIGSKLGVPYAEPFTFLTMRYCIVLAILVPISLISRAPWPAGKGQMMHVAFAGLLIHALYLSGCVWALKLGLPAGVVSLIVSMQPLFTAAFAGVALGERVLPRQWMGLALGFIGTIMVVAHKMGSGVTFIMTVPAIAALVGITAGTMWQKRHCPAFDLRTSTVVQYAASLIITAILAVTTETMQVQWSGQFVFALLWVALVLSIGAITLLNYLIKSGTAVNVASLFYTVPAVTAIMAWGIFGETLTGLALVGMVVAVLGVWLARGR